MSAPDITDPSTTATESAQRWRARLDRIVPTAFLIALAFVQRPGWTAADTKLDLVVDPGGFLGRAMNLWDPLAAGGQLQNQAYGYLFPMGPFFWLGDVLGFSPWVVQRLWWALILVLAYHGTLRVLERLGIGTGWSRILAAFSYALAPRMLMGLGAISSEIWPMAIAPWILLPLLAVAPGGERPAALRSGAAILLLGAVNAVASLATLILPLWWILTRTSAVRVRLLAWWSVAVVLATAWWIGPLVLLGRYSPPFLDWIEDARVTTAVASVTEALRGTTQWIATIGGQENAVWPAGWAILTTRNVILFGLVIALAGLLGLALARGPWTGFARGGLIIGLILVTFGHGEGVAGPWSGAQADLLDGVLAPFRNTHKCEPVVRLPLALGVAHGLPLAARWLRRVGAPWPQLAAVLVVLAIIGQTAVPAFVGVIQRGPFLAVPTAWQDAAQWLEEHPDGGRTLILPGGNAPARMWGEPKDEPIQPYMTEPWIVRDGVPLGSAGATRLLNEIEARVAQGRGGPELVALLDTLGVTRVLVVADHQRPRARTTPPIVVRAALTSSGAQSVASFGSLVGGSTDISIVSDWGLDRPLRELEILEVSSGASIAPTTRLPVDAAVPYAGGPEGIGARPGTAAGLFTVGEDPAARGGGPLLTTDTLQRRQASFATATDLYGPLLSADEEYVSPRAVHDYWPTPLTEDRADLSDHQSVRVDDGTARATASSTLAEPALGQGRELNSDAWRAFDASGETAWRSSGYDPLGQWVQLEWATPTELPASVLVTLDTEVGANVAALSVSTDTGTERTPVTSPEFAGDVDPARYKVSVDVPPGPTMSVRLTVEAVRDARPTVRVLDIGAGTLPRVQPWVRLPLSVQTPSVVALQASSYERSACYPMDSGVLACSPDRRRVGEETNGIRRELTLAQTRSFTVTGTVVASGEGADSLLRRLDGVRAAGSSRWLPEPGVSPDLAVDGDAKTYWAASPQDTEPRLTLSWPTPRLVEGLRLEADPNVAGRRPTVLDVTLGDVTVRRTLGRDGTISLPPSQVTGLTIAVVEATEQESLTTSGPKTMPVVIGDVALIGDAWSRAVLGDQTVELPCGFGPTVQVGGQTLETSVSTTRGRILNRQDATLTACDGPAVVPAGRVRVQALSSGEFSVRSLVLDARYVTDPQSAPAPVPVTTTSWGATSRSVDLGPASERDTLLVVRENANEGWVATAGAATLKPVTVDGWAQSWVVPAGTEGTVELRFAPQRVFLASLAFGGALAALLVVLVIRGPRVRSATVAAEIRAPGLGRALAVSGLVAVGGVAGAVAGGLAILVRRLATWRSSLVTAVTAVAGGAAVAWVGWALVRPWPSAGASNRDVLSGALALFLVGVAATWGTATGRSAAAGGGATTGVGLERRLEQVPAEGSDDDRGDERQHHGDPEPVGEDVEPQR